MHRRWESYWGGIREEVDSVINTAVRGGKDVGIHGGEVVVHSEHLLG